MLVRLIQTTVWEKAALESRSAFWCVDSSDSDDSLVEEHSALESRSASGVLIRLIQTTVWENAALESRSAFCCADSSDSDESFGTLSSREQNSHLACPFV